MGTAFDQGFRLGELRLLQDTVVGFEILMRQLDGLVPWKAGWGVLS